MEPKSNSIKLSMFLKYGLTDEKSSIADVWLGSKYASVNKTLCIAFFKRTYFIESWWNILRFYLKKNEILRMHVKDMFCNSLQDFRLATLLKRDSDTGVFLGVFRQLWNLLLNYVFASERVF